MHCRWNSLNHIGPYAIATVFLLQNMDILLASALKSDERSLTDSNDVEEVFNPSDQLQQSFDEYPMVVPKRAALLLDRLMVALHHALEERNGHRRISDLYSNNQNGIDGGEKAPNFVLKGSANDFDQGGHYDLYEDAPSDFDFRDLNLLSRAPGETRKAHGRGDGFNGGDDDSRGGGGGGGGGYIGEGRVRNGGTWKKCYLNVITCF